MEREHLDSLIICGNQYAGFEGATFYISGFEIVHRYVYVVLPLAGEPTLVFPREARWIGDKAKPWIKDQVWPEIPGHWIRERAQERGWKRLGVYGMSFIMAVRDYRELAIFELVPFDFQFDMARAVKSEEELAEVRDAMDIILDGFWALEAASKLMRAGEIASSVHRAVADSFAEYGFSLGHLSGHSIGATMIEHPAIGAKSDIELKENMIFSLHPQVVDKDGKVCLYTQDTYRIGKNEGECLADVPWKFYSGSETREAAVSM